MFAFPVEMDLNINRRQSSLVFPVSLSVSILGQILAGTIQKYKKPKWNFFLAALLFLTGFLLAAQCRSIAGILLSYGIMVGLAIGIVFNAVMSNTVPWFSSSSSIVAGLLLMSFGLGTVVLGALAAGLIQIFSWRFVFLLFAVFFSLFSLLGALIIKQPPLSILALEGVEKKQLPPLAMVKTPEYKWFFIWFTSILCVDLVIPGHAALYARDMGAIPYLAALATGCNALSNVISRFLTGFLGKFMGEKKIKWMLTAINLLGTALCLLSSLSKNMILLFGSFILLGFVNGGVNVISNNYILECFGRRFYGINLGISNIALAAASFLGPAIAGAIRQKTGSYTGTFLCMLLVAAASVFFLLTWTKRKLRAIEGYKQPIS
jgi:OFA family oxalate/formate antiporter-like MFS transporter